MHKSYYNSKTAKHCINTVFFDCYSSYIYLPVQLLWQKLRNLTAQATDEKRVLKQNQKRICSIFQITVDVRSTSLNSRKVHLDVSSNMDEADANVFSTSDVKTYACLKETNGMKVFAKQKTTTEGYTGAFDA